MTTATAFLLILWIGSHLAIVLTIHDNKFRLPAFAIIGLLLLVVYAIKPYTYDLQKYSIYFDTGFIETVGWSSPGGKFQLDERDTTGLPFRQGFEPGFRWLAKAGNIALPKGSLVPRIDPDAGDLKERGPPRSDAMVYLVMLVGFFILYSGAKRFIARNGDNRSGKRFRIITAGPIVFGSIFFLVGSQNSLRQFLGVSIVVLALSMLASRRHVTCLILIFFSAAFHKWAPILGAIGVTLMLGGRLITGNISKVRILYFPISWMTKLLKLAKGAVAGKFQFQLAAIGRFVPLPVQVICRLSSGEMLSLMLGIMTIAMIKGIAILGIFTTDLPLVGDLKPYLIMGDQYASMERLGSLVKAGAVFVVFACSEILLGRKLASDSGDIRSLRRMLFVFVIPLAVYPEIFSRILILYWAIELILVVWALNSNQIRTRLAAGAVFVAYGFAPNAINVLIGPGLLQSY
jgi:hypothetical protein